MIKYTIALCLTCIVVSSIVMVIWTMFGSLLKFLLEPFRILFEILKR